MSKITFLGAGNIAQAIIGGLKNEAGNIIAADPSPTSRDKAKQLGISVTDNNDEAVAASDVVLLCVKPDALPTLLTGLTLADAGKLFISVAAGVTTGTISSALSQPCAVIRCMPNTPALLGCGMTAMYAADGVGDTQRADAERILGAVGETLWVDRESDLDAVTAVSGSGPAYYFLLMEAMIESAVKLGLGQETARKLVLQTALGSATMAARSKHEPGELRRQVTSPGGTTEAAIDQFDAGGFSQLVTKALEAAKKRAVELSQS